MTKNEISKEALLVMQAIRELEIDVPVMRTRLVGDRVELFLYGGAVIQFPEESPAPKPKPKSKTNVPGTSQRKG